MSDWVIKLEKREGKENHVITSTDLEVKWHHWSNLSSSYGSRLRHIYRDQVWVVSCVLSSQAVMALEFLLMSTRFNYFLLLRDEQNFKCVGGVLVVIKCKYLPPTYLHFIKDIEDRCLLLMSSMSLSTISGTSNDAKAPYGPKSMHIFIMSQIRHSHRQYDTRKWRGTKRGLNRAKVWPPGHTTLAGRPCVGTFPKTILFTCLAEAVLKVSNVQRQCKEETWPPRQVAWSAGLTSGPHMYNLQTQHRLTLPINTMVLPPTESVKRVWFSPL
jgi:hypothetical protein